MINVELINKYIKSQKQSWTDTTLRSECYRLRTVAKLVSDVSNAKRVHDELSNCLKPYSLVTTWTRLVQYYDWLIEQGLVEGENPLKAFREKNKRLFKNSYVRKPASLSFEEARNRVNLLMGTPYFGLATFLLETGCRYTESLGFDGEYVVGKGGKKRRVYTGRKNPSFKHSYAAFYNALKKVGLKPHDLRKIALSKLVEYGANVFELCEIAGWSSLNTAQSYIKANDKKLEGLVGQLGGVK
jgi:hypothetical protein